MATPPASAAPPAPERASPARDAAPSGARDAATPPPDAATAPTTTRPGGRRARAAAMNARDILSGKREREGFFDAEDEARRDAAAKRLAAKRAEEKAEEELIAAWREEDRLKQEARQAELRAAKIAAETGSNPESNPAADEKDPAGGPDPIASEPPTATAPADRPADQFDANGDLIVGTTGRSKKRPGSLPGDDGKASGRSDPVPPPPPPEPTEAFEAPVESAAGVPCFGCHACGYRRDGCDACLRGPKVRSAYEPAAADHQNVPSAPTYRPTEEEWAGDPLAYINSIRPEAEKYGVCNIIAPDSWQPQFRLPGLDRLRFRTRVQAVNELQNRPAGPSKRAREVEAEARAALEAAGLSLPPGFLLGGANGGGGRMGGGGGGGGGRMGGGGATLERPNPSNRHPTAPGTPPEESAGDALSQRRREASEGPPGDDVEGAGAEGTGAEGAEKHSSGPEKHSGPPGVEKSADKKRSHKKRVGPMTEAEEEKAGAILAQYGFAAGERHTVATLERYSRYFKSKYFSVDGVPVDPLSVREIEGEFWRLVQDPRGRTVEVVYGADIATLEVGSGFTGKEDACEDAPEQRRYATSPWNVCNMPYNQNSCLKHVEATTGITVPWLYFGMTLSTFCWHVEDHHFYSVNYHHFGDPKVWYSVPASHSEKFEAVMRRKLPHLFDAQPDLLHSLVTILSPAELEAEGIPVFRAVQSPRSYIITFPYAYHAGFNCGFNCAEAVNFAPVDWLPFGAVATEQYVRDKRYQSVAHDQLLGTLCDAAETQPGFRATVARVMRERVETERRRREDATPSRVAKWRKMEGTEDAPDLFEKDCARCQADLNWAGVRCECKPKRLYCLRCVKECKCAPERATGFYRHTLEELEEKCARLEALAEGGKDGEGDDGREEGEEGEDGEDGEDDDGRSDDDESEEANATE